MSNQTYRSQDIYDDRYTPSPLINKFTITAPINLPATTQLGIPYNKCNYVDWSAVKSNPAPPHAVDYRDYPGFKAGSLKDALPYAILGDLYSLKILIKSAGSYSLTARYHILDTDVNTQTYRSYIYKDNRPVDGDVAVTELLAVDECQNIPSVASIMMAEATCIAYLIPGDIVYTRVWSSHAITAALIPGTKATGETMFQIQKL